MGVCDVFDEHGIQQVFTIRGNVPETRQERLERWEKMGLYDPNCPTCVQEKLGHKTLSPMMPNHKASPRCQSGGHNHCTCDTCF